MAKPPHPTPTAALHTLLQRAQAARQAGNRAAVLPLMEQAVQLAPASAPIRHDLGLALLELGQTAAALPHFNQALALDPTLGLAYFRRGVALELLGQPGAAHAYQRAIETAPTLAPPYGALASAREQQGARGAAQTLYRQAQALSPKGSVPHLIYGARAALIAEELDSAETLLRAALAQQPKLSSARGLLANILTARGHFPAAAAELERALADKPSDVALFYNLLQTRRADEPLLARMQAALRHPAPAPARLRLHLALARGHNQLAQHEAAQRDLQAADKLRATHHPMDRTALRALTDRLIALFTPAYLNRPDHQRSPSPRPILVLGLPRSGTTLAEQILASHPAVAGAGELPFWTDTGPTLLATLRPDQGAALEHAAMAYLAQLHAISATAEHVVDKNPFNYLWAMLAHLAFPNARIIHCRRNRADNALSIMLTALRPQPLFGTTREDLLLCCAEYDRLMAHTRALLPPDRVHDLHYETLVQAPEPTIRALLQFCGLPFHAACLAPEQNQAVVRSASVWQVRQPINAASAGAGRHYATWLEEFEGK